MNAVVSELKTGLRIVGRLLAHLYRAALGVLEERLFPAIVRFATHPLHVTFLLLLWIAILVFGWITVVALTGGNYFNGLCGLVSVILLLQQSKHHVENKQMHERHASEIAHLHAKIDRLSDARATATGVAPVRRGRPRPFHDPEE